MRLLAFPALIGLSLAVSFAVTGATRRYALARGVLDTPNERSSHTRPTPRGGGLGVLAGLAVAVAGLWLLRAVDTPLAVALAGGGAVVAGVGWWDDHSSLPARWRALAQAAAAVWAVYWLGGLPSLGLGSTTLTLGVTGAVLATIGLVWLINLYNFMDGIDGIAGGEAVTIAGAAGALLWWRGHADLAWACWAVAAASAGFLAWNWPPAKIFMGDVGSGLLGYVLGVLALASERRGALPFVVWLILLACFALDATVTLLRRMLRGERWYEAHRSHAYQHAVRAGHSHGTVTATVLAINAAWLFPWAALTAARPALTLIGLVLALLPIAWLCWRYDAGGHHP